MAANQPHTHEVVDSLTARIEELATCPESAFNADEAINVLEEADGGSLASKVHTAGLIDFTPKQLDQFEIVVRRFDNNPPPVNDNDDLELYTDLVSEAQELIALRRAQIKAEMQHGGRQARIEFEMGKQHQLQQNLFLDMAHNSLNAEADLQHAKKRRMA